MEKKLFTITLLIKAEYRDRGKDIDNSLTIIAFLYNANRNVGNIWNTIRKMAKCVEIVKQGNNSEQNAIIGKYFVHKIEFLSEAAI